MAKSTPWRDAMLALLSDGEPHAKEDVIAVGAAVVDEERALQEMRQRSPRSDHAERVRRGRRTVAQQALSGMVRFRQAKIDRNDMVTKVGDASFSDGELLARLVSYGEEIDTLKAQISWIMQRVGYPSDDSAALDKALTEPGASAVVNLFARKE